MDIAGLPLVGGHAVLDLVNTVERGVAAPGAAPRDFLGGPADVATWAGRAGVEGSADGAALDRLRELREAVHTVVLDRLGLPAGDVDGALQLLGRRAAAAAGRSRLVRADAGRPLVREIGTEAAYGLEDRLATAAVELLTGPDLERMRRCPVESGGCGWVFLDRSKNHSRTWCRMADCGNAVKARRLTERRRQERTAGSPS
jgi:predicted RNA-binding Zn ribbon-like protein